MLELPAAGTIALNRALMHSKATRHIAPWAGSTRERLVKSTALSGG